MHARGLIAEGLRVHEQVALIDVLPTLLDLLSLPVAPQAQGQSLVGALGDNADARAACLAGLAERPIYAEAWAATRMLTDGTLDPSWQPPTYALRTGTMKFIFTPAAVPKRPTARFEVYDLARDPLEKSDISERTDASIRNGRKALMAYAAGQALGNVIPEEASAPLDPATTEKLKALGYLR